MNEKERYLQTWENEFQTTLKVIRAYPADKLDLKPHEKSRSARDLIWTFMMEEKIMEQVIQGEIKFAPFPPAPQTLQELLSAYEDSHKDLYEKMKKLAEAEFSKTVKFPVGPQKMADLPRIQIFWFILMDMIHHSGQFSVYLRMAGGKVPSIYGPSADEPWM